MEELVICILQKEDLRWFRVFNLRKQCNVLSITELDLQLCIPAEMDERALEGVKLLRRNGSLYDNDCNKPFSFFVSVNLA